MLLFVCKACTVLELYICRPFNLILRDIWNRIQRAAVHIAGRDGILGALIKVSVRFDVLVSKF